MILFNVVFALRVSVNDWRANQGGRGVTGAGDGRGGAEEEGLGGAGEGWRGSDSFLVTASFTQHSRLWAQ